MAGQTGRLVTFEKQIGNVPPVAVAATGTARRRQHFMRKKQTRSRNTYQETIRKLPSLIAATQIDSDDKGFFINVKKLCRHFDVTQRTLNNYIRKLIDDGILKVIDKRYETGLHTMRYSFDDWSEPIEEEIADAIIEIYNGEEEYDYSLRKDVRFVSKTQNRKSGILTDDVLLIEIQRMTDEVNKWSPIKLRNSCKWEEWTAGNRRIRKHADYRGRVYNALCFTKSGKKQYKNKDNRPSRSVLLKQLGLDDYSEIYDIKSQVPRVSHFLTADIGFFQIEDYHQYFRSFIGDMLTRERVKEIGLRCYFEKSKGKFVSNFYRSIGMDSKSSPMKSTYEDFYDNYRTVNPMGNEIFLWTSLLELYSLQHVHENYGIKCINVYDGFWAPKSLDVNELVSGIDSCSYDIKILYNKIKLNNTNIYDTILPNVASSDSPTLSINVVSSEQRIYNNWLRTMLADVRGKGARIAGASNGRG